VSSVHAAATRDLVKEGVTGFSIDPHDAGGAAATILKVLEMPEPLRNTMGRAGYEHVCTFDAASSAARMVRFMRSAMDSSEGSVLKEGQETSL